MRTRLLLKAIIYQLRTLLKVQCLQLTKRRGRRPQAKQLLMLVSVVRARDDAISHLSEKMILYLLFDSIDSSQSSSFILISSHEDWLWTRLQSVQLVESVHVYLEHNSQNTQITVSLFYHWSPLTAPDHHEWEGVEVWDDRGEEWQVSVDTLYCHTVQVVNLTRTHCSYSSSEPSLNCSWRQIHSPESTTTRCCCRSTQVCWSTTRIP